MANRKLQAESESRVATTTAVVTKSFFQNKAQVGETATENDLIEVQTFVTEPSKVGVTMGLTLNLGNFESARIDVSLSVPCYREDTDAAYDYARRWVESRIGNEVKVIRQTKPNIF